MPPTFDRFLVYGIDGLNDGVGKRQAAANRIRAGTALSIGMRRGEFRAIRGPIHWGISTQGLPKLVPFVRNQKTFA
jgi:hypothetical protein